MNESMTVVGVKEASGDQRCHNVPRAGFCFLAHPELTQLQIGAPQAHMAPASPCLGAEGVGSLK